MKPENRLAFLIPLIVAITIVTTVALVSRCEGQEPEETVICVYNPKLVLQKHTCEDAPFGDLGCNQLAAQCDQEAGGQNLWSVDYNSWLDPYSNREYCNGLTDIAAQRIVRIKFTQPEEGVDCWVGVVGAMDGRGGAGCLPQTDPGALPPDVGASSQEAARWNCNAVAGTDTTARSGAYLYSLPALSNLWPSEADLFAAAGVWDGGQDYRDAYSEVVSGLATLEGYWAEGSGWVDGSPQNPYGGLWATAYAMRARMSIFARLAYGQPEQFPNATAAVAWFSTAQPIGDWDSFVRHQVCRYVLKAYAQQRKGGLEWLLARGWPTTETPGLNTLMDSIYLDNTWDPAGVYEDTDVEVETTTWGKIKIVYR